jgi:hypothetical protein
MNTCKLTKNIVRTTLLCTGLVAGGGAWSGECVDQTGAVQTAAEELSKAETMTVAGDTRTGRSIDPELYDYLHDADIHKPDNLSRDYGRYDLPVSGD